MNRGPAWPLPSLTDVVGGLLIFAFIALGLAAAPAADQFIRQIQEGPCPW